MASTAFIACGGGSEGGFGVYESSSNGAAFTFTIPAPSTSDAILEFESYRVSVEAPQVTYILVEGQNNGDESASIPTISIVNDTGETLRQWRAIRRRQSGETVLHFLTWSSTTKEFAYTTSITTWKYSLERVRPAS